MPGRSRGAGVLFKADASLVDDTDVQVPNDSSAQNPVEAKTHVGKVTKKAG